MIKRVQCELTDIIVTTPAPQLRDESGNSIRDR